MNVFMRWLALVPGLSSLTLAAMSLIWWPITGQPPRILTLCYAFVGGLVFGSLSFLAYELGRREVRR